MRAPLVQPHAGRLRTRVPCSVLSSLYSYPHFHIDLSLFQPVFLSLLRMFMFLPCNTITQCFRLPISFYCPKYKKICNVSCQFCVCGNGLVVPEVDVTVDVVTPHTSGLECFMTGVCTSVDNYSAFFTLCRGQLCLTDVSKGETQSLASVSSHQLAWGTRGGSASCR